MDNQLPIILVIEDDLGLQKQIKWCLDAYNVLFAENREDAIKLIKQHKPAVVTLDLGLPPDGSGVTEGFLVLEAILLIAPHTKVILLTSNDEKINALRAIALGAYDYYQKPFDDDGLKLIIQRAYYLAELEDENRRYQKKIKNRSLGILDGFVTESDAMISVCQMIEKIAPSDITVLLLGESGTGKEVLARALHDLSERRDNKFVAINCASIPEGLLESELFGHEKGAFTGAFKQTIGKFEMANGGTLFLDEAGDLPAPLQAKLLRFLQERVIERVGGREEIFIDIRVICATNKDLKAMIKEGYFREDLYYRMNEIEIIIPPLRDRAGDVSLLAKYFLIEYNKKYNKEIKGYTSEALNMLEKYPWPGNVRELMSKIKRAVILEDGNRLSASSLGLQVEGNRNVIDFNLKNAKEQLEETITREVMNEHNGNITKAASIMGVSRPTLYTLLDKYKISFQ